MPVRLPLSGWSAWIVVAGLLIAKEGSHAWSDEWGLVKRSCLLHHQVELDFSPFYKTKNNSKITYIDKKCIHKWLKLCIHSQLYHFPPQNWKVKRKIILLFFPLVTENKAQKRKKNKKQKPVFVHESRDAQPSAFVQSWGGFPRWRTLWLALGKHQAKQDELLTET